MCKKKTNKNIRITPFAFLKLFSVCAQGGYLVILAHAGYPETTNATKNNRRRGFNQNATVSNKYLSDGSK